MSAISFIATIVAVVFVSAMIGIEEGLLFGLLLALLLNQWALRNRFGAMQQQIDRLREQLAELKSEPSVARPESDMSESEGKPTEAEPGAVVTHKEARQDPWTEPALSHADSQLADADRDGEASERQPQWLPATDGASPANHLDKLFGKAGSLVLSYFTDGNIFVRVGLLVLFFGIAFLLKYAAESNLVPIEMRYMGAALGGLALLVIGWRLRNKKPVYGLLLQGGGIGVIYITIFAAFKLAGLLPSALTFTLLVLFAAFSVALALLQDSKAIALYAVLGGFLAPLLASTGSGNYIVLFSYYAVLNLAVFAVAWFRAWRALNLLGFFFTFGVFAIWTIFDYRYAHLYPALGFLLLFFLMYSLIGVLYALRQPERLSGYVDGTLVFGTPVIVSGLMMAMLRNHDYGIAAACAGLGIYYLLLARYAWRRIGAQFSLMAEALLAIGVVFATLAIPYALDGHWSSAAWALEAAGILWVSIRQQRFYAQCFAVALQLGSGVMFYLRNIDDLGSQAWFNPAFIGGLFIALGAFISARMLYLQDPEFKLRRLHIPFYLWAMGWWLGSALIQIDRYIQRDIIALLLLFGITAGVLVYLDRLRRWNWMPASISVALLLPVLALISLISLIESDHVFTVPEIYFWLTALAANYWMISRLESVAWPAWVNIGLHTAYVVFLSLLLSVELVWIFENRFDAAGKGYHALLAVMPLLALQLARVRRLPAILRLGDDLQLSIIGMLSAILFFWCLNVNLTNSGDPAPLPYIPFVNPLDLVQMVFFLFVFGSLKLWRPEIVVQRDHVLVLLAGLVFIWLTAVLTRSMHHFLGIPFDLSYLLSDTRVQTGISILWTLIGMSAIYFASRRARRLLWIVAAALIGIVLVKMFFIDLRASGTIERILSFLVVGSLLVATGYFSPIPGKPAEAESQKEKSANA